MAKSKAEIQADYAKRSGYAANNKYNKANTTAFTIRMMNKTDSDIIAWLNAQPNKAGYIKSLIRADMQKTQQEPNSNE